VLPHFLYTSFSMHIQRDEAWLQWLFHEHGFVAASSSSSGSPTNPYKAAFELDIPKDHDDTASSYLAAMCNEIEQRLLRLTFPDVPFQKRSQSMVPSSLNELIQDSFDPAAYYGSIIHQHRRQHGLGSKIWQDNHLCLSPDPKHGWKPSEASRSDRRRKRALQRNESTIMVDQAKLASTIVMKIAQPMRDAFNELLELEEADIKRTSATYAHPPASSTTAEEGTLPFFSMVTIEEFSQCNLPVAEDYFAWSMDWRLQYLLVKKVVAREIVQKMKSLGINEMTQEQCATLARNLAKLIRALSVGDKRKGVVNVYFSWCDIEEEHRMILDLDEEASFFW